MNPRPRNHEPAALTASVAEKSSINHLQANLEIVDWTLTLSRTRFPGEVSITTKSIGDSELRPIWRRREKQLLSPGTIKNSIYLWIINTWNLELALIKDSQVHLRVKTLNNVQNVKKYDLKNK